MRIACGARRTARSARIARGARGARGDALGRHARVHQNFLEMDRQRREASAIQPLKVHPLDARGGRACSRRGGGAPAQWKTRSRKSDAAAAGERAPAAAAAAAVAAAAAAAVFARPTRPPRVRRLGLKIGRPARRARVVDRRAVRALARHARRPRRQRLARPRARRRHPHAWRRRRRPRATDGRAAAGARRLRRRWRRRDCSWRSCRRVHFAPRQQRLSVGLRSLRGTHEVAEHGEAYS